MAHTIVRINAVGTPWHDPSRGDRAAKTRTTWSRPKGSGASRPRGGVARIVPGCFRLGSVKPQRERPAKAGLSKSLFR